MPGWRSSVGPRSAAVPNRPAGLTPRDAVVQLGKLGNPSNIGLYKIEGCELCRLNE